MPLSDLLLPEFDAEIATTRKVLERVPDDRIEWRPHEKSFPMGHLAQLVAMIPGWTSPCSRRPEFDIAPREGPTAVYRFLPVEQLLEDVRPERRRRAAAHRRRSATRTAGALDAQGGGQRGEHVSRGTWSYRTMVLNHLVHHRAQLGFYLRLTDQKVPPMYGPTADDK